MACTTCGGKRMVIKSGGKTSGGSSSSGGMFEVFSAKGATTGRKFTSRGAAEGYASRIGGTVKPVG